MRTTDIRILVFTLLLMSLKPAKGGSGLGVSGGKISGRVNYIGIGSDTLFSSNGVFFRSPYSCSDAELVGRHLLSRAHGPDSFQGYTGCTGNSRQKLSKLFRDIGARSRSSDYFVFYFGGYTQQVSDNGKIVTAFFLRPPVLGNMQEKINTRGGIIPAPPRSDYFTLDELRMWMNAIPARNQVLLIEAGFTRELKEEFSTSLIESDETIGSLEKRQRVLLFPNSYGVEDSRLKAGRFTWCLTAGLDSLGWNLLDVFSPARQDFFAYNAWKSYISSEKDGASGNLWESGFNMLKEWEMQEMVRKAAAGKEGMRNETIRLVKRDTNLTLQDSSPHFYALVIGTNNYSNLTDLKNPVLDAESLAKLLVSEYGFKTRFLKNAFSAGQFAEALKYYDDSVVFGPRDEFLVFIAGHGTYNDFNSGGFIAFGNSLPSASDPGMTTWFDHRRLAIILDHLKCKKIMLVMDVCYGGALSIGLEAEGDPRMCNAPWQFDKGRWPFNIKESRMVYKNLNCANRVYITSGGFEYVGDGTPGSHSPFAAKLLAELDNQMENVITASELFSKIKRAFDDAETPVAHQDPTSGRFGLDNNSTDFIFVRKKP